MHILVEADTSISNREVRNEARYVMACTLHNFSKFIEGHTLNLMLGEGSQLPSYAIYI
jgi:hypothetical protein